MPASHIFRFFGFPLLVFIALSACRKKEEKQTGTSAKRGCELYTGVSNDVSYLPHHTKNHWEYCSGDVDMAGYVADVTWDTLIGQDTYFDRLFYTSSRHAAGQNYDPERWKVDAAGKYYRMIYWDQYKDTVLMIDPGAANGDTISRKKGWIILVDKNETILGAVTGCYHVRETNGGYSVDHYYKKGIGELFFNNAFTLSKAVIY